MYPDGSFRLLVTLSVLYFLQGLPYGFQIKFIPIRLRKLGYSLFGISILRLINLPWMLKFLWAPILDRYRGKSTTWLLCCIFGMASISFIMSMCPTWIPMVTLMLCLFNFLSATSDIAVDAITVRKMKPSELGYANIAQVVGYKIGMLIGGGFLLWLDDYLSWSFILLGFTIIYTAAGCLLWIHDKYRFVGNEIKDQPDLCRADKSKNEVEQASWTFLEVLQSPGTKQMALLALIYKLGEQCFVTIFPLMLLDNGTSAKFVGSLTGVFGQAFSIFGSTLGGVLLSKWRFSSTVLLRKLLWLRWLLLIQYIFIITSLSSTFSTLVIIESLFQLTAGMITTTMFTLMMKSSKYAPDDIRATHYTILAVIEVSGKLTAVSLSGIMAEYLGYTLFFLFCNLFDLVAVFIVCFLVRFPNGIEDTKSKHS